MSEMMLGRGRRCERTSTGMGRGTVKRQIRRKDIRLREARKTGLY